MTWAGFHNQGGVNTNAYIVGSWDEIVAVKNNTIYQLGNCADGALKMTQRYYRHYDTTPIHRVDYAMPIYSGMSFSGRLEEIHAQNVSFLLGQTLAIGAQNYIYVGDASNNMYYFTLRGRRRRPEDGVIIEFQMHKCMQTALFSLASGDDAHGSTLDIEGLDDTAGDYGGSESIPVGQIYVPTGPAPITPAGVVLSGGWGDGVPDYTHGDGWGDGFPDF